jgi:predicted phage replisome organizer
MSDKKYYWIKLKEDFFEEDVISWIEEQEKGVYYSNFYLKLCLKAMNSEGRLIRKVGEMLIPYDVKTLSKITGVDQDTVIVAMELLKRTGLIEILENGEIYLTQLKNMIGSESKWAEKKRLQRAKGQSEDNVPLLSGQCPTEKEKEKEKDKDKDKEKDKDKDKKKIKHKYGNYNHVLLTDNEKEKLLNELDEYKFNLVIEKLDEYIEETGKKYKNHYLTIKRWVIEAVEKDLVKNISTKSISQTKKFIPATQKQCDDAEFKRRLEESNKLLDSLDENIWGD